VFANTAHRNPLTVSIIIPVWNGAHTLAETLDSVRGQTFKDFKAIVVDDGSTDDTPNIARRFSESDPRFFLISQAHAGTSAARNNGIQHTDSRWIALLDTDDVWLPEKLERQMALSLEDPGANFLFTNYWFWDGRNDLRTAYPDNQPFPEVDMLDRLIFHHVYLPSSVVVRRESLLDAGLFDSQMLFSEDWDMWLRLAEAGIRARGCREPLVRYRRWPGSSTIANRFDSADYNAQVIERGLRSTRHHELIPLFRRSLAVAVLNCQVVRARHFVEADPEALPPVLWRILLLDPRWKWLRWYLGLIWPVFLGGNTTRQYVRRRISKRWKIQPYD
jgi:glycosyltransferase involved in cell wall biosynthesis